MAGEAKTSAFMLGTATVMLGPLEDVFDLTPEEHSIGLVKNFRVTQEQSFTDLSQGVKNTVVFSKMTGSNVRSSMEVYEYTARNMTYALGLEGSAVMAQTVATTVDTPAVISDTSLTVADETGFVVGDYIMIQIGNADQVLMRKVSAVSANTIEFTQALPKAIPAGASVIKSNAVDLGSKDDQPFLAAKIVGTLADDTEVVIMLPKVRVTSGFSVGFTTEGFDNMPFELASYDQVAADPFFLEFGNAQAKLFTAK